MSRKKVKKGIGAQKRFKDLQQGDPLFMLNPNSLNLIETVVHKVQRWNHPLNVSGEAIEVIFYKPVVDIEGITIEKLQEMYKEFDAKVHKTLICNKEYYLVITNEGVPSIPVPICTTKETLQAWVRGETI